MTDTKWDQWKALDSVPGVVDLDDAARRVRNKDTLFSMLLGRFLEDMNYAQLKEALAQGDLDKAREHAHSLKGVAGNLSLTVLQGAALQVETEAREGSVSPEALANLDAQMERATAAIHAMKAL